VRSLNYRPPPADDDEEPPPALLESTFGVLYCSSGGQAVMMAPFSEALAASPAV
jgi:hypothetical protein